MPPCTCSALSVTLVSMSTAFSFDSDESVPARGSPASHCRAAYRTSWRAASMSGAFSARWNEIARPAGSGCAESPPCIGVLDGQLRAPPSQPDAGHRDRDARRRQEPAQRHLESLPDLAEAV